ncbi:hypothetical protein ABBQ38_010104 [Trebouxia sp. C0009 RCD-2024]
MTGLSLRSTEAIQAILRQAASCPSLSRESQGKAQQLLVSQEVPWQSLRDITQQLRKTSPQADNLWLHEVCQGSQLVLCAPPKREKSKELQARLSRLQQQVDQASYNKMVAEVTQQERAAEALRSGSLQTYKQQISFGLHVIVMMGTFFAVGYIAGTALSPKLAVVGPLPLPCTAAFQTRMHSWPGIIQMG